MHKHLIVSGRVQGVGFRFTAQQKAAEFGLTGWVRNNSDGTVEMEIEGGEQSIQPFMEQLKDGFHSFIRVEHIEENSSNEEKGFDTFSIK
ncbi:acylphosphatase [Lentibacillus sediminis]|uniref:acylphosphatase n=1 Tax=Lentibacillus sediminis TaxID=1940529 RepID=UPI000C1C348C|nr:acylphosphatase [Lentibacillus sediminis]